MNRSLPCFKAYAIRGRLRDEFNEDLAFRVGLAFAKRYRPDCVAVGHDVRHSSPVLLNALANGLALHGVKVLHLGLCATEEMYWAAQQPGIDGGFMVTGGHHPAHHNGIKLLLSDAVPLNRNNGWHELEQFTADSEILAPLQRATTQASGFRDSHLRFLQRYLPRQPTRRITIVVNPGNGCGAPLLDALESSLPFKLVKMNHRPDGSFPNGIADPLLPEMRAATGEAVRGHHADFGVAWDIDMDRSHRCRCRPARADTSPPRKRRCRTATPAGTRAAPRARTHRYGFSTTARRRAGKWTGNRG